MIEKTSVAQLSIGIIIVCITLWFGWYPFNFVADNDVVIDEKNSRFFFNMGLKTGKSYEKGMAYTTPMVEFDYNAGATFHFILTPLQQPEGLGCILTLFDGGKQPPFVIAQWQDHLALFNNRVPGIHKEYQEVGLRNQLLIGETIALTVSTTAEATEVFIDGKPIRRYSGFSLLSNNGTTKGKIIIGNNMYGTEPWHGSIDRIAIFNHGSEKSQNGLLTGRPIIDYKFETLPNEIVSNRAESPYNLFVSDRFKPLARSFFAPASLKNFSRKNGLKDVLFNIIGFIPISFCIAMFVRQLHQKSWKHFLSTVSLVFLFSLVIETTQAFLPSRTSSQLDLLCNTFGGMLVAFFLRARIAIQSKTLRCAV